MKLEERRNSPQYKMRNQITQEQTKAFVVYGLTCPIDKMVRYVGCTCNLSQRFMYHLTTSDGSKVKFRWIKKLKESRLFPIPQIIFQSENKLSALRVEKNLIQFNGDVLFNVVGNKQYNTHLK